MPANTEYQPAVRSLTRSISEVMPYFTGLSITEDPVRNTSRHGEQIQLREQQPQYSIAYELTGGVCEVARHPPHRSRSRRGAGRHTKLTARPTATTCTTKQTARERAGALTSPSSIILPGWRRHTGGSRSIPTVHPCGLRSGGCG